MIKDGWALLWVEAPPEVAFPMLRERVLPRWVDRTMPRDRDGGKGERTSDEVEASLINEDGVLGDMVCCPVKTFIARLLR
jgi:hypothetical protein